MHPSPIVSTHPTHTPSNPPLRAPAVVLSLLTRNVRSKGVRLRSRAPRIHSLLAGLGRKRKTVATGRGPISGRLEAASGASFGVFGLDGEGRCACREAALGPAGEELCLAAGLAGAALLDRAGGGGGSGGGGAGWAGDTPAGEVLGAGDLAGRWSRVLVSGCRCKLGRAVEGLVILENGTVDLC